ncbi:MAG: oligopeptidase A [Methylococcales bacterium]|nr:oligopeptidase A [Methylococcales bacterium]MBT7108304.1 oligopeptidase A [Methylococcales bacterium]MBT7968097.1 oligopeptidase A [Methylococcales bacterium]
MNNPLLTSATLPPFSEIKPSHIEPAIDHLLEECRAIVKITTQITEPFSWENLVNPIEKTEDRLNKAWSPVSHINSVVNNNDIREAYNACLPKLSQYSTEMGQNKALYNAYFEISNSPGFSRLNQGQQKTIQNALRDFELSGINLNPEQQCRYREISQELSKLSSKFEENVLDATHAWKKHIQDETLLAGIPETTRTLAKTTAETDNLSGWMLTLDFPCYLAIMTYADNPALRQEIYTAFATRASDVNPDTIQWDNTKIMDDLLALRHEKARLLGFNNYAELSLATKMADTPQQVIDFLENLAHKSKEQAQTDFDELQQFAKQEYQSDNLNAWDINYFSEKMRQQQLELSQEEIRNYFPATRVIPGLFTVVNKLYGLTINEISNFDRWHSDVRFFEIYDQENVLRGKFYLDLYARPNKRGGAWMDDCVSRKNGPDGLQTPVAYLTCNFTPPANDDPALLSHNEVITLFHEFGHGLHHMLTKVDHLSVSGINGVQWDAVELPSQFMENWCWQKPALEIISGHYQTGAPLPESLLEKMLAAKNFQSGMFMIRQLEFSLFDFQIHLNFDPTKSSNIYSTLSAIRDQFSVVTTPAFNRFAHSFSHIFAGGYAAGYYSYKWAELLSCDAFSRFEDEGIFNPQTGADFLTHILEKGGSIDAMDLFVNFRGREPSIDALLQHNGIIS